MRTVFLLSCIVLGLALCEARRLAETKDLEKEDIKQLLTRLLKEKENTNKVSAKKNTAKSAGEEDYFKMRRTLKEFMNVAHEKKAMGNCRDDQGDYSACPPFALYKACQCDALCEEADDCCFDYKQCTPGGGNTRPQYSYGSHLYK